MLRGYVDAGGSPDSLGRAERFFLHLIKIPRLSVTPQSPTLPLSPVLLLLSRWTTVHKALLVYS